MGRAGLRPQVVQLRVQEFPKPCPEHPLQRRQTHCRE